MTVLDTQLYTGVKVASNFPHMYQGQHPGSGLVLAELREVKHWGRWERNLRLNWFL